MPELSRFYGIVVRMFFNDHAPPHFHAYYGSDEALFAIETLSLIAGVAFPLARPVWLWSGLLNIRMNLLGLGSAPERSRHQVGSIHSLN